MPIQDDINQILHAQSGEAVRGAIVNAIQDLNQNGGNAQTLNGHYSDEFTKNAEFQKFIDDEVGQVHVVLDAINKGITLRVIELGTKWIGPEAGTVLIEVPESVKDRQLLTVDDFYADIVEVASGTGSNAHWEKTDYYDTSDCTYTYSHGALASAIKLHFYAKRASATAVQDYNVHEFPDVVDMNARYVAPAGEAYNEFTVNVDVPVLQPEKIVSLSSSETIIPDPDYDAMESVQVNIESPSLERGGVVVNQATYDQTFTPTSPNVGFSEFRVQANVQFNTQAEEVRISDAEFEDITVTPDSLHAGLSQVTIVNDMQLEEVTVNQNGDVTPGPGYTALKKVTVAVPVPVVETGRSVTYSSGGTYTVNPTGNNDAMDSVEVTVQTPVLQPSKSITLSQSGTVTPDPGYDAMEEVVVTVSGGGGDCNIMTKAEWDALPFAEKKRKGLTVIRETGDTTGDWYDYSDITFPLTIECELYDSGHKTVDIPAMTRAIVFQGVYNNGVGNYDNIELASPLTWSYDYRSDYNKVTPIGSENPHDEGWYELSTNGNRTYYVTSDTTVNPNKTYYTKEDPNMIEVHYRSTDTSKMIFDSMVTVLDNTSETSIYYENGYNGDTSYSVYGAIISIDDANADITILGEYYDGISHEITTDTDYDAIICIVTKASQRANFNGQIDVVGTYTSKFDGNEKLYNDTTKSCISVYYGVESGAVITARAVQDQPGYTRQVGLAVIGVKANNS